MAAVQSEELVTIAVAVHDGSRRRQIARNEGSRQLGRYESLFFHVLGGPFDVEGAHRAVVDRELPILIREDRRLVAAVAGDGTELVEIHDSAELARSFGGDRAGDGFVDTGGLESDGA